MAVLSIYCFRGFAQRKARQKDGVEVRFRCESMELAGEALQDLGHFLKVFRPQYAYIYC